MWRGSYTCLKRSCLPAASLRTSGGAIPASRWRLLAEVESRTEGSRPRPRTQKKSEAKDSLSENRPSRGQGQECSRPWPRTKDTATSVLQKRRSSNFFSGDPQFIGVPRIFDWKRPKPQITCYDAIKNFQKRKFLWDKDIAGWKI